MIHPKHLWGNTEWAVKPLQGLVKERGVLIGVFTVRGSLHADLRNLGPRSGPFAFSVLGNNLNNVECSRPGLGLKSAEKNLLLGQSNQGTQVFIQDTESKGTWGGALAL
jgi:hypothetical protein